jgi:hypothetical protein
MLTKRALPVANGFFENAGVQINGNTITVLLENGGEKILTENSCDKLISRIIKERFGLDFEVILKEDESSTQPSLEEIQNRIDDLQKDFKNPVIL